MKLSYIDEIKFRKISETGNLESRLSLKVGSQVMIISDIDIIHRLVNGLIGSVTQFKYSHNVVSVVYVKFNDDSAVLEAMR